jgi:hypothetical protein
MMYTISGKIIEMVLKAYLMTKRLPMLKIWITVKRCTRFIWTVRSQA